jgi:predicted nucleotide-binding protein (sugar kinase/HSP70/actin superfamily)
MGRAVISAILNVLKACVRPLIPVVQELFGMTREAARGAIVWVLEKLIIALIFSAVTGVSFFVFIRAEIYEKLHKDHHETASRLDKLEKDTLEKQGPKPGTSDVQTGSATKDPPAEQSSLSKLQEAECNAH